VLFSDVIMASVTQVSWNWPLRVVEKVLAWLNGVCQGIRIEVVIVDIVHLIFVIIPGSKSL
jgi:hypothetical protein